MARQKCEHCGKAFDAKTKRARFCSSVECRRARARLRKRSERGQVLEFPAPPKDETPVDSVHAATLAELVAVTREHTPLGRAALVLAGRLDRADGDTGSSTAALARELRVTLEEALRDAPRTADALDDLEAQRQKRRQGA